MSTLGWPNDEAMKEKKFELNPYIAILDVKDRPQRRADNTVPVAGSYEDKQKNKNFINLENFYKFKIEKK